MKRAARFIVAALFAAATCFGAHAQYPINPYAATYQTAATVLMSNATNYDFACIEGVSGKKVRIFSIAFTTLIIGSGNHFINLFFRTSLSTGGSSTLTTWVPRDTSNPAPSLNFRSWSSSQPAATGTGTLFDGRAIWIAGGINTISPDRIVFDYTRSGKVLTLNSATEAVCFQSPDNLGSGGVRSFDIVVVAQQG